LRVTSAIQAALRTARVPGNVAAKVMNIVDSALGEHGVRDDSELLSLPDWNVWMIVIKSILSPSTKLLRQEGYCHANAALIGSLIVLDERLAQMIREWVKARCGAGLDPCCRNPQCCNIA